MKKLLSLILGITVFVSIAGAERIDRWANLRFLAGTWKMETPEVTNTQHYEFLFNGTFLQMKTRAVFKPTDKKPKGEVHEDLGVFSYDGIHNNLVLRCFYSEGFVNTFVLKETSENGNLLIFITESVENAPAGTRARLTLEKISEKEFVEKFYVAWPDKDYICYSDNHLKKVE